jgi:hypothetical protein
MMADLSYWAYAVNPNNEGRMARGFVLAADDKEARRKAKEQVERERLRFARSYGISVRVMRNARVWPKDVKRIRLVVWKDPNRETAPNAKHYVENNRKEA